MPVIGQLLHNVGTALKLPEFGLSEKFGVGLPQGQIFNPSPKSSGQIRGSSVEVPSTSSQITGGTSTSRTTGTTSTGAQSPVSAPATNNIQDQLNVGNDKIDIDYNSYINDLNAQQGQYQNEAANAESAIQTQAQRARGQLSTQKATQEQGLSDYETQANKAYSSTTQQARDMYRQVQQQNIAQLSAQGLSSSSVAEALAEKLGVETARRVTSAAGSLSDVVTNINKERKGLNDFYQTKLSELEQDVTTQISGIRQQLLSGIDALNRARNVAAGERANKRQELLVSAQSAIYQIKKDAQAYQQSLDTWTQQKTAALADTTKNLPAIWQNFNQQMQGVTQAYGNDFTLAPQLNADSNGNIIPTGVSVSKKKSAEEDLAAKYGL